MILTIFREKITNNTITFYCHLPFDEDIVEIKSDTQINVENSIEGKYFGPSASEHQDKFFEITVDLKTVDLKFYYDSNDEQKSISIEAIGMSMYANRKQFEKVHGTSYMTCLVDDTIHLFETSIRFEDVDMAQSLALTKVRPIYLFHDRRNKADDNAEALYRHYMKQVDFSMIDMFFVIDETSGDYHRLKEDGFKIVALQSPQHKMLYTNADAIITSNTHPRMFNPYGDTYLSHTNAKLIALNHGVVSANLGDALNRNTRKIDLVTTVGYYDTELYKDFTGFGNVVATGLARFDNYKNVDDENYILYFPTWNKNYMKNLQDTVFYKEIINFITSTEIQDVLDLYDIKMKVLFHPVMSKAFGDVEQLIGENSRVEIIDVFEARFAFLLGSNRLLITDSSSIRFDNLYQQKNVITYCPYEINNSHSEYEEENFLYKANTIKDVRDLIVKVIDNNWEMESNMKAAVEDFFNIQKKTCSTLIADEIKKLFIGDTNV